MLAGTKGHSDRSRRDPGPPPTALKYTIRSAGVDSRLDVEAKALRFLAAKPRDFR